LNSETLFNESDHIHEAQDRLIIPSGGRGKRVRKKTVIQHKKGRRIARRRGFLSANPAWVSANKTNQGSSGGLRIILNEHQKGLERGKKGPLTGKHKSEGRGKN